VYPATQQWARPIADELWLLSHNEQSGRAKLDEQRVAIGLAGAIICELLIDGLVTIAGEQHVFLRYDPRYGRDEIAQWALTEMDRADGQIPVAQWIWHLCGESSLRVADRLAQTGAIEYVKSGLLGGSRRAVPANANVSATPRVRMLHQLATGQVDVGTLTLGALAVAIDLDTVIARDAVAPGLRNDLVFAAKEYLHQHLRDVANAVRAAATQANMTIRR
jgi:Golgi phosphoprotein 3 GPP34